jgi:hypothetical protein
VRRLLELAAKLAVGAGLPLSQLAIQHLRWPAAAAVATVSAGILTADLADLATGHSQGTVRRVVRIEAVAAGVATITGVRLLVDPNVQEAQDEGWALGRAELFRRLALGLLFAILSARIKVQAKLAAETAEKAGSVT